MPSLLACFLQKSKGLETRIHAATFQKTNCIVKLPCGIGLYVSVTKVTSFSERKLKTAGYAKTSWVHVRSMHRKPRLPKVSSRNIKTSTEAAVETSAALQSPINKQALPEWPADLGCSL